MTITDLKPHRRQARSHGVAFWNDNTASNEEEANRAVVYTGPPGMPYPEFTFKLPDQRRDMEKLESMLMKAFSSGIYAGKEEIRDALGIQRRS